MLLLTDLVANDSLGSAREEARSVHNGQGWPMQLLSSCNILHGPSMSTKLELKINNPPKHPGSLQKHEANHRILLTHLSDMIAAANEIPAMELKFGS